MSPGAWKSLLSPGPFGPGHRLSFFGYNCKHMFVERFGDVDVAKVNAVEGELDSFVARRDRERRRDEGERPAEEIWAQSVRTYNGQLRRQKLINKYLYESTHIERLKYAVGDLISRHEAERDQAAAALLREFQLTPERLKHELEETP